MAEIVAIVCAAAALATGIGMIVMGVIAHRAHDDQIDRLLGHMDIATKLAEYRAKLAEAYRVNATLQQTVEDERRARAAVQRAFDEATDRLAQTGDVDALTDAVNRELRSLSEGLRDVPPADPRAATEDARGARALHGSNPHERAPTTPRRRDD